MPSVLIRYIPCYDLGALLSIIIIWHSWARNHFAKSALVVFRESCLSWNLHIFWSVQGNISVRADSVEKALYLLKYLLIILFSKDSVGCWGRVGMTLKVLSSSPLLPHHDLHQDGAAPLSDKVLGNDCVNKLSPIFTFWRDLPKSEEILKVSFFSHNDQYRNQPVCPFLQGLTSGNLPRSTSLVLPCPLPVLPFCPRFSMLRNHKVLKIAFSFSLKLK